MKRGDALRRAKRLEWITVGHILVSATVLYLSLGASVAMKSALLDDFIGLVPPVAFLVAVRFADRPPSDRHPYGFQRVRSMAYALAAMSIVGVGLFILYEAGTNLASGRRPDIRSVELFGHVVWGGWTMLAALAVGGIPRALLGRLKRPLAADLHDKTLDAEAELNKADWLSSTAAAVGVIGIGFGLWWTDSVAALIIAVEVLHDGWTQIRSVTAHLLGEAPRVGGDTGSDLQREVEDRLRNLAWVSDVRVRMREEGSVCAAEVFVVPRAGTIGVDDVADARRAAEGVDERLADVVVMPVATVEDQPHHLGRF